MKVLRWGVLALAVISCVHHAVELDTKESLVGKDKVEAVVYPDGREVWFKGTAVYDERTRVIAGEVKGKGRVEVPLDSVMTVKVERVSGWGTLAVWVIPIAFVVAAVAASSCPFVYSDEGSSYALDAEPLGGAISLGLERREVSVLEHLRPSRGAYRIVVANEKDETQFLDELKLVVVDHEPGTRVLPDFAGNLHVVGAPTGLLSATDEEHRDLRPFLNAEDDLAWQSMMPAETAPRGDELRHDLVVEFPLPPGAASAQLVVRAATSQWGATMVKEMLQLRGRALPEWYRSLDSGGLAMENLVRSGLREELFLLNVYVERDGKWVQGGTIHASGPYVPETRVATLDLAGLDGDRLRIRVRPPIGYWAIDYMAVSFDHRPAPATTEVPVMTAVDQTGRDVAGRLRARDGSRLALELPDDHVSLEYTVPPAVAGLSRTVCLSTVGYYRIHVDETRPEQREVLARLENEAGGPVAWSIERHAALRRTVMRSDR